MGGYGSGRCGHTLTTKLDEGLKLNIHKLKRKEKLTLNVWSSGVLQWNKGEKHVPSINYELSTIDQEDMWMRIRYTHTTYYNDEDEELDYKIRLTTTQPHYGGKRLWFLCPLTGKRAATLYLPSGYRRFASRYAYNLKYMSQSKSPLHREIDNMWRLKNKLGGEGYWCKPKGMHSNTFKGKLKEIYDAEEKLEVYMRKLIVLSADTN